MVEKELSVCKYPEGYERAKELLVGIPEEKKDGFLVGIALTVLL